MLQRNGSRFHQASSSFTGQRRTTEVRVKPFASSSIGPTGPNPHAHARPRSSMNLVIPPGILFHPGPRLLVYRPRGILTENRLNAIITYLEKQEDEGESPFNRFTDLSKLDALKLDVNAIIRISLYRRLSYGNYAPVKSAFYVTTEAAAELVKVHVLLTNHSPIKARMYDNVEAAAKWLDVSPGLLEADTPL